MVAVEPHLWLTLADTKEKHESFLLDVPLSKDGVFGDSIPAVVEKFAAFSPAPAVVFSCSPSLQHPHEVQRSEPLPMEPLPRPRTRPGGNAN